MVFPLLHCLKAKPVEMRKTLNLKDQSVSGLPARVWEDPKKRNQESFLNHSLEEIAQG